MAASHAGGHPSEIKRPEDEYLGLGRVAVWPDAAPAAILLRDKAQCASCSVLHERAATPYCGKMALAQRVAVQNRAIQRCRA
jgi:hypothetical protein